MKNYINDATAIVNKTEEVGKKSVLHCCYCRNIIIQYMIATISGMFIIGDSAKTVFSSLLFTRLCRTGNFYSRQFVDYVS